MYCPHCGCLVSRHSEAGCHGVQRLLPWETEPCTCRASSQSLTGVDEGNEDPEGEAQPEQVYSA